MMSESERLTGFVAPANLECLDTTLFTLHRSPKSFPRTYRKPLTMHDPRVVEAGGAATARLLCVRRPYPASRILDATQIHRRIAFSSATASTLHLSRRRLNEGGTLQRFNESRPRSDSSLLGQCLRLESYDTGALPRLRLRAFHRRSSLPSLCYRNAGNSVAAL